MFNSCKSGFEQRNNCQQAYKLDGVVMSRGQTCVHAQVNTRPMSAGDYPSSYTRNCNIILV